MTSLATARLLLRPWRESDKAPFAELNADPRVTATLAGSLTREESDAFADRIAAHIDEHGWGLWAIEVRDKSPFIGYAGLSRPSFEAPFTPCVEIGWRLAFPHWSHGYATEAALAVKAFAFDTLRLAEIVSFTTTGNLRSRAVIERIGLARDPADDFDHPRLGTDHPLRPHVLYRTRRRLP
ncbi:ribosomal-protein-alanine N-acetyltransferase/3-dehydroquinate dehydratase/shikimate dehydrogenase [Dongia mobilis]|uniref:Ribosomal-protein-alanine N-acetyltransferase/3-dehydroquinate dehydratase/shikimate dehydrogenase n=1 Tax=Dongia mobilis TaxID=578943 RepID=A0A4R6WDB1_9PROT|nr:GNAT family N-acetyltransferase [Dongia mobilis]TDQ77676.1 ribosomal-protein-alanine N-acetyltransferase/3-dehydroquinate dehydratase/shikimate dehydrogenase [Dongia mobilis]